MPQILGGSRPEVLTGLGNQNAKHYSRQAQTRAGEQADATDKAIRAAIAGPIPRDAVEVLPSLPMMLGS
ncbi:MAG TPA: hypothetical protein VHY78_07315, partial [Stellaceae bacterium]|nr:hypothetical protein [Stellaceae bacterium]